MQGASRGSVVRLTEALGTAIEGGADGASLGEGLFAATDVLRSQATLRRAVTDPAMPAAAKRALATDVFGDHLDATTVEIVGTAVGLRWSASGDLVVALERLGVVALVKAGDAAGEGDRIEDELFALGQAVSDNHELRDALSDPGRSVGDKQALVRGLLEGRASAGSIRLAERSVTGVHLTVTRALDEYAKIAAEARNRLVALVRAARPLDDDDQNRLGEVLSRQFDRPVHLNVVVEPALVGGVRVEIGDQVIDGSISSRLDDARRGLVG